MKKSLFREIQIPKEVEVTLDENLLIVKGSEGENKREFKVPKLIFEKKEDKIVLGSEKATKKEKRLMNTLFVHIQNMIKGVQEKFVYEMKICSSHFPMSIEIKDNRIIIKNFFGEKNPRIYKFSEDIEINKEEDKIIIKSIDKEKAGQAAASIETTTKIRNRDRRIFQDGIYIISKAGRKK